MAGRTWYSALLLAPAVLQPSMVWSAAPSCAVTGKGYTDPEIAVINGGIEIADAQSCQTMCASSPTCKVFTFYITSGGCWLQGLNGTVPPLEPIPGVMSGPKVCPDVGTDLGASPADASDKGVVVTDAAGENSSATGESSGALGSNTSAKAQTMEAPHKGGGFPIWVAVMIALLAIVGAVVGFYVFKGDDSKKGAKKQSKSKKRAIEMAPESPHVSAKDAAEVEAPLISSATSFSSRGFVAAPATAVPLQTVTVAAPTYAAVAPPVLTSVVEDPTTYVAAPMVTSVVEAPSVAGSVAVPPARVASSVKFTSAASSMRFAAAAPTEPIQQTHAVVRQTPQQDLFDRLDTNHDGVLTRAEFAALAEGGGD